MNSNTMERLPRPTGRLVLLFALSCGLTGSARAETVVKAQALGRQELPNMNQVITPLAAPGSRFQPMNPALTDFPAWLAQDAAHCVVSPDQKTLAVLTSGYNRTFYPYGTNANAMNAADST